MTTQHPADREPQTEADIIVCAACRAPNVLTGEQLDAIEAAARSASDTPRDGEAFAWLIERGQNRKQTPPIYWRSRGALPSHTDEWTADPWLAARFSTRAAAEEAIHSLEVRLEAVGDPVEHRFLTRSSEARTEATGTEEGK